MYLDLRMLRYLCWKRWQIYWGRCSFLQCMTHLMPWLYEPTDFLLWFKTSLRPLFVEGLIRYFKSLENNAPWGYNNYYGFWIYFWKSGLLITIIKDLIHRGRERGINILFVKAYWIWTSWSFSASVVTSSSVLLS